MFSSTNLPRSTCSPTVPSLYRGSAVFFRLEKTSLRSDTSFTSLCLVTTQNGKLPSSSAFPNGRLALSQAKASRALTPSAYALGSITAQAVDSGIVSFAGMIALAVAEYE